MRVVEHWWNASWGRLFRKDVRLQLDDQRQPADCPYHDHTCVQAGACVYTGQRCAAGIWQLWIRDGDNAKALDYRDEHDARTQLGILLDPQYGHWRRLH